MTGSCFVLLIAITIFAIMAIFECVRLYNQLFVLERRLYNIAAELAKYRKLRQ